MVDFSKPSPFFFKDNSDGSLASKLIVYVDEANYAEAKALALQNPELMFQRVLFTQVDGTPRYISPLQYAFRIYDATMWKIFKRIAQEQPGLMMEFIAQTLNFNDFLDLTPLFDAYEAYLNRYDLAHSQNIDEADFSQFLLSERTNLRDAQSYLPRHMIFEMTKNNDIAFIRCQFDDADPDNPPSLGQGVEVEFIPAHIVFYPLDFIFSGARPNQYTTRPFPVAGEINSVDELERFFQDEYFYHNAILTRGDSSVGAEIMEWAGIYNDAFGFHALREKRHTEFLKMQSELRQLCDFAFQKVRTITTIMWMVNRTSQLPTLPFEKIAEIAKAKFQPSDWQQFMVDTWVLEIISTLNHPERSKPEFLKAHHLHSKQLTPSNIAHSIWLSSSNSSDASNALKEYGVWAERNNIDVSEKEVSEYLSQTYTF